MIYILGCCAGGSVSLGPYAISHHLKKHGYSVKVVNFIDKFSKNQCDLLSSKFVKEDILCISSVFYVNDKSSNIQYIVEKAKHLGIKIVVGGINSIPELNADYNLIGSYTEDDTLDLFNKITGRIRKTFFNIESNDFVWSDEKFCNKCVLPVEISRHCIFNCKFCSYPSRGMKGDNRELSLFLNNLNSANKLFGTETFLLVCSTFNDSPVKLKTFFEAVKYTNYKFSAYIRLDLLIKQKEFWPEFKKHIKYMTFGIETLNWASGKAIGKGTNPSKIKEWLKEVRDYFNDTFLYSSFIVGLPNDCDEDAISTQKFLSESMVLDGYSFNPLYLERKTGDSTYLSEFSLESEKNGYAIIESKGEIGKSSYINADSWIRSDGYTSDMAEKTCIYLNNLEPRLLPCFSLAALSSHLSDDEIRKTWYIGTFGLDAKFDHTTMNVFNSISSTYINNQLC